MQIILYAPNPIGPNNGKSSIVHNNIESVDVFDDGVIAFIQPTDKDPTKTELIVTNLRYKIVCDPREHHNIQRKLAI